MLKKDFPEEQVFTVSQFLDGINILLSTDRPTVVGEVSEFKFTNKWTSFSLKDKDDGSILKCVAGIWDFKRIGVELQDGMEVKVSGVARITKSYGSFSLWVQYIEPVGEGSLKKAYDLLLKKLELEGLFVRKRPVPKFISSVGVISSRDGVVIQDFLKNLRPLGIKISFLNSRVEGRDAPEQIIRSLRWFNDNISALNVLIVIRGGGSLESMQAFNNEAVCREIFASKIPVITGIGHDVDVPIASMVSDVSVSTPTAVANLINQSWDDLVYRLPVLQDKMLNSFGNEIEYIHNRAGGILGSIMVEIRGLFTRFEFLAVKITRDGLNLISNSLRRKFDLVDKAEKIMRIANPERNLKLGYSLTYDERGKIVRNTSNMKVGDRLKTILEGGDVQSVIDKIN